jgi:hypothetical protein
MPEVNNIALTQELTHSLQASDWIALSSVIIALCVFFTTLWQAWLTQKQAIISVRPLLIVSVDQIELNRNMLKVIVYLENVGVGPAIIKLWSVYSDNLLINNQLIKQSINNADKIPQLTQIGFAFEKLKTNETINDIYGSDKQKGFAIKAGSKDPILTISVVNSETTKHNILNCLDRLKLVIEYQDLYKKEQPTLDTSKNKLLPH